MKLTTKQLRKMIKEEVDQIGKGRSEEEQAYINLGAEVSEMTLKYYQVPLGVVASSILKCRMQKHQAPLDVVAMLSNYR